MKKIFLFIFFKILLVILITSSELSPNFKNIINIDSLNEELINLNITEINYNEYFRFFVIVSEEYNKFEDYKKWFNNLEINIDNALFKKFKTLNIKELFLDDQKLFAEVLLELIHDNTFFLYEEVASKISDIVEKKRFNCVSSSIMYSIFLLKYGFNTIAIETKDHVFIEIKFEDTEIDVETTNRNGFDPGKKKDVLDNFGKITGFTYVPKKNYDNRKNISLKRLLLIIYHNLITIYFKKGNTVKAANLAYIIYQALKEDKNYNDFLTYFTNHLIILSNNNKYETLFNDISSFFTYFGLEENIVKVRYELIAKFVTDFKNFDEYEKMENFLLEQKDLFVKDKDINEKKFFEIHSYFIYITTNYLIKNKEFDKAFEIIKRANLYYNNSEFEKIFNNILLEILNNYTKNDNFEYFEQKIINLKANFPQYIKTIRLFEKNNFLIKINKLINSKKFKDAFNEIDHLYFEYKDDQDFKDIYLNLYIKYIDNFYTNNDIENVIKNSEIALTIFKDNKIILNNYKVYLYNYIIKNLNLKNFIEAKKYLNIALQKFLDDRDFKNIEIKLKEFKY